MLKIENAEVLGWEHAIRGMRNPKNSWAKSDSGPECPYGKEKCCGECQQNFCIGPNDKQLMMTLRNAGTDHRKFMRMITVYLDITAPLYWWKEFDTYKVGTVANSCSTMMRSGQTDTECRLKSTVNLFRNTPKSHSSNMTTSRLWQKISLISGEHFSKTA